jgi:hypothetical protein
MNFIPAAYKMLIDFVKRVFSQLTQAADGHDIFRILVKGNLQSSTGPSKLFILPHDSLVLKPEGFWRFRKSIAKKQS